MGALEWKCKECGRHCAVKTNVNPSVLFKCRVSDRFEFIEVKPIPPKDMMRNPDVFQAVVNKEPELMTFFEAWEKAETGDKVQEGSGATANWATKGKTDLYDVRFSAGYLMKKCWKIIPAEPVVLSAEDMLCHMDDFDHRHDPDIIKYGEIMDINGQRRRDRDYRELVNTIKKYKGNATDLHIEVFTALENLKPLEG